LSEEDFMSDKKFIDGLPSEGVRQELHEGDRGTGSKDWLQFRVFWGEHPQRNEVRVLDDDITVTDAFPTAGSLRGGKVPASGGKVRMNPYKAGLLAALAIGLVAVADGAYSLVQKWFNVQAFEFPSESANFLPVGTISGTGISYALGLVVLLAVGFVVRSLLPNRRLSRMADLAVSVAAVVMLFLSLVMLGGPGKEEAGGNRSLGALPQTMDLVADWQDNLSTAATQRAAEYINGPIVAKAIALTDNKGNPIEYRNAILGPDRCGERDESGKRSGECNGMIQIVDEAIAELDRVALEVAQTDAQTCLVDKSLALAWVAERQDKKAKKTLELPKCEVTEIDHRIAATLKLLPNKIQQTQWARERGAVVKSLLATRQALEVRRYGLAQALAGNTGADLEVAAAKITKIRDRWRAEGEEQFKQTEAKAGLPTRYPGGVACSWQMPSEEAIKTAKKEKKEKPEPVALCSRGDSDHATALAYTDAAAYGEWAKAYGDLKLVRVAVPEDPSKARPANDSDKPVIPVLESRDQRSMQIAGIDIQDDLTLDAKTQKVLIDGLQRRFSAQAGKVFTRSEVSTAGTTKEARARLFLSGGDYRDLVAKAAKAKKATGPMGITCEAQRNKDNEEMADRAVTWVCKKPSLRESVKGANADLVAIARFFKHPIDGTKFEVKFIERETGKAVYMDSNSVTEVKKIGTEVAPMFDRLVLGWSMKQRRIAEERARALVSSGVVKLKHRVSESNSDKGRTEAAFAHITGELLLFVQGVKVDSGKALSEYRGSFLVERQGGFFWAGLALLIALTALGINLSTREVEGDDLVVVTGASDGVGIDLKKVDGGRVAIWDGSSVISGDGLASRKQGSRVGLNSGEVVAFKHEGAAYSVRYISSNLDVPPGQFEEAIPDAALLEAVHPDLLPGPQIDSSHLEGELHEDDKPIDGHRMLEVAVYWGHDLLDTYAYGMDHKVVEIGASKKADIPISHPVFGDETVHYHLADCDGRSHVINIPDGANFEARLEGGTKSLADLKSGGRVVNNTYRINDDDVAAMKVGALTLVFRYVRQGTLAHVPLADRLDWLFTNIATVSLMLHVAFIIILLLTPQDPSSLSEDLFKNPNRFVKLILKEPEKKEEKREKLDLSGAKDGGKHKDKEGKFGKKDKPKKDALASKKGAPTVDPNKRERDRKIAFKSGLLGLTGATTAVSNVLGPGGLGTGINNALGGLKGSDFGEAGGAGGLGYRGTGGGGGGNALGIGGLGSGTGRGTGGAGSIDLGGRGKGTTRIIPGRTTIMGSLSREEIARVIRRHLNQIKHCYEKELTKKPNLRGKVTAKFIIAGTGRVQKSKTFQSTLHHAPSESCINRIIKRMIFPQPRGGGIVMVKYPFMFSRAGR
jgi:hypothetical protein